MITNKINVNVTRRSKLLVSKLRGKLPRFAANEGLYALAA